MPLVLVIIFTVVDLGSFDKSINLSIRPSD